MKKKIGCALLVDDDMISNYISEKSIKSMDISEDVKIVTNGEQALQYIEQCDADTPCPELIFLDINMPVMGAFHFLALYKSKYSWATGKVIILSTSSHPNDIETLYRFGIADYINKPLSKEKVAEVMKKHFDW
jgi:CheY-like chemotaxis protein